jgi:hypothetical protein
MRAQNSIIAKIVLENDRKLFRYLVCLVVVWLSLLCSGQVIKIRVVNGKNGQALQKQQVSVSLLYDRHSKPPKIDELVLRAQTDTNGQVEFKLPQPPPPHLSAQVTLTSGHWRCGCTALIATQELIQKGITIREPTQEAKRSNMVMQAIPKEMLFYARPLTFFERLLYPLVKQ